MATPQIKSLEEPIKPSFSVLSDDIKTKRRSSLNLENKRLSLFVEHMKNASALKLALEKAPATPPSTTSTDDKSPSFDFKDFQRKRKSVIYEKILVVNDSFFDMVIQGKEQEFIDALKKEISERGKFDIDNAFREKDSKATFLHFAARYQRMEIIVYLVETVGVCIESFDLLESTPLIYACAAGSSNACAYLLQKRANPNAKDQYGVTPFIAAIKHSHLEIASFLILNQADINIKGPRGFTALHLACSEGSVQKVGFLLAAGASSTRTNQKGQTVLMLSVTTPIILRNIMEHMAQYDISLSKYLLAKDDSDYNILHHCAEKNAMDSFTMILKVASDRCTPAALDTFLNDKEVLGHTPLHMAVKFNRMDMVRLLLAFPVVRVDEPNNQGNTPLHLAVQANAENMAQILVHMGRASTKVKNNQKKTPTDLSKSQNMDIKKEPISPDVTYTRSKRRSNSIFSFLNTNNKK